MIAASGIAAVSAYEAHIVNVTAHVENAIETSMPAGETTDYGTVFPQEWHKAHVRVELSESAIAELAEDLTSVDITLYAEWKPVPAGVTLAAVHNVTGITGDFYPWLGEALWVGTGPKDWPNDVIGDPATAPVDDVGNGYLAGDLVWVGPAPVDPAMAKTTGHTFTLDTSTRDILVGIGLDTPVFEGYYNEYTDPAPKPSFRDDPSFIIQDDDAERYFPDGEDASDNSAIMGIDLKFQVTDISRS